MKTPLYYLKDIPSAGGTAFPRIEYGLPQDSTIVLEMYDVSGEKVSTLFNGKQKAGAHSIELNAVMLGTGTYFCRMAAFDSGDEVRYVNVHKLTILS